MTTGLREEYEDLLRYAVVTPVLNTGVGGIPTTEKPNSGGPPPRPYTPPRNVTRTEMKAKGIEYSRNILKLIVTAHDLQ